MAKEMNMSCDFLTNQLMCELPEQMMDVMLKVRTRNWGAHIQRRYLYAHIKV